MYRLYKEEGLTLRHKPRRKRRAAMHRRERFRPTAPNQVWGWISVRHDGKEGAMGWIESSEPRWLLTDCCNAAPLRKGPERKGFVQSVSCSDNARKS